MKIKLANRIATANFAQKLAAIVEKGDVMTLHGELGVGKTFFCQAFISAMTGGNMDVTSPTYTIVQKYPGRTCPIWHFDLYRLDEPDEAHELGLEDAFADGICLIEWPTRMNYPLPEHRLDIDFHIIDGDAREVTLKAWGHWEPKLDKLKPDLQKSLS